MFKEDDKMIHLFNKKPFSRCKNNSNDSDDEGRLGSNYQNTPSIITNERRRPSFVGDTDERYERTDGAVIVDRGTLFKSKSDVSPSSITPIVLFNIAISNGTFAESLVTKNGFAIGNYYRYWQNLFDLRPCPSIYAITVTYEILGKEDARNFLLKNFEEKFIWLRDTLPLGYMYDKSHGPLFPPSTIEMMFALGEKSWINGNGEYLIRYTRNAKLYMKELNLCSSDDLDDLEPIDMDILIETVADIICYK